MSKLDELRRAAGTNVAESMSKDLVRPAATHCASAPAPAGPDRWAGLERLAGAQRIPIGRISATRGSRVRSSTRPSWPSWPSPSGRGGCFSRSGCAGTRAGACTSSSPASGGAGGGDAGQPDVPCVIHDVPLSEAEILLDQLAENIIRLDLQPIEQARAFRRLMDANGWSARRLAEEPHIDHDKVNRAVRLLELPGPVQAAVAGGALSPTTAYELSKLPNPAAQAELATRAVAEGLSRDDVAAAVRRPAGGKAGPKGRGAPRPARRRAGP